MKEREAILTVALEQHMVSLLVQCVTELSDGKFSHLGCSLNTLLEWAWSRLHKLKVANDRLCEFPG